jgi:hypothetical protein
MHSESQTRGPEPRNPKSGDRKPRDQESRASRTGLTNLRHEKPWACSPRDVVEPSDFSSNTTSSGRSGCLPPYRSGTCLPSFAARGMMTAVVLGDGRRRAVDRSQLGTMNHPMHRRPRRRSRKWNTHRRGPGDRCRSWANPGTAENSVGESFSPRCRWLRSDLSAFAFSIVGLVRCAGRSRLMRSIPPAFRILRAAVLRPEGAGTDQPGAECSAAPGSGANGSRSPEGATQTDASIVSPLQGFLAALIRYPGRRRRSHNSRRLALG